MFLIGQYKNMFGISPIKERSVKAFVYLDLLSELWQSTLLQILFSYKASKVSNPK